VANKMFHHFECGSQLNQVGSFGFIKLTMSKLSTFYSVITPQIKAVYCWCQNLATTQKCVYSETVV